MPHGMSNSQWKALPQARRFEIEQDEDIAIAAKERVEADDLEITMLHLKPSTSEIAWLRDRILALEARVIALESK